MVTTRRQSILCKALTAQQTSRSLRNAKKLEQPLKPKTLIKPKQKKKTKTKATIKKLETVIVKHKASSNSSFYSDIAKELRLNTNRLKVCQDEKDVIRKCLLCRYYLSSMQWGPLMEKFIKDKFKINKPKDSTSGDGCSPKKKNIEIKVSLGTSQGAFNFVQIRPDHKIHYYLFLAYDLYFSKEGRVFWFLCKSQELYKLIPEYGGYAHGTVAKFGKITLRNLKGRNMEYALRPSPHAHKGSKPHILWQLMMKKFYKTESAIMKAI